MTWLIAAFLTINSGALPPRARAPLRSMPLRSVPIKRSRRIPPQAQREPLPA
ncbi:MAG: hypothetical protein R6U00_11070 [Prochlorococcaceae cyanobacterium]